MEDTIENEARNIVDQVIDQSICPDCEHPVCIDCRNSAVKRIEAAITAAETAAERRGRIAEAQQWAMFFEDNSMNAMTPSERLYERVSDLQNHTEGSAE